MHSTSNQVQRSWLCCWSAFSQSSWAGTFALGDLRSCPAARGAQAEIISGSDEFFGMLADETQFFRDDLGEGGPGLGCAVRAEAVVAGGKRRGRRAGINVTFFVAYLRFKIFKSWVAVFELTNENAGDHTVTVLPFFDACHVDPDGAQLLLSPLS